MELLRRLYTDPRSPGSFSGVQNLLTEARKHDSSVTRRQVEEFLERERTYTLHKRRRVRYKRLQTVPSGFMTDVQVDLADFQKLVAANDGNNYVLLGVDVMSRRIFAVPVKSKHTASMKAAFEQLFLQMPCTPWKIFSDKGLEFESPAMKAFFRARDILKHVSQSDDTKACVAERNIQTLKRRIYRYLSHKQTKRWVDVLPTFVDSLNHTNCRVTGMRPVEMTEHNWQPVWQRLYAKGNIPGKSDKRYAHGTTVRIDVAKGPFAKGYLPTFSQEVFKVKRVRPGNPTTYALEDQKGEAILGKFYAPNFSKSQLAVKRIANVWDTRKRRGVNEYYVSWVDENPQDREWITAEQLI